MLLIPAHNEQAVIATMIESVKKVDYDTDDFEVSVIADNCTDRTAEIALSYDVNVMIRKNDIQKGKGFAIEWALKNFDIEKFDAVVIADADNIIDPNFFNGLNNLISLGHQAIQCNNCLSNPEATAFTQVIHLSRTINNELYHYAKHKLGLSSYLMGNGMCFTTKLLKKFGWSAGTIAEDYEYYAKLVMENELIGFANNSKLYHQESSGIRHATQQRIRWSSGRFYVAKAYGMRLLKKGFKEKKFKIVDASLALLLPNLSMLVNITAAAFVLLTLQDLAYPTTFFKYWIAAMLLLEFIYFTSGIFLTNMSVWKFAVALAYCPLFLVWKGAIDLIGIVGKKLNHWGKAERL